MIGKAQARPQDEPFVPRQSRVFPRAAIALKVIVSAETGKISTVVHCDPRKSIEMVRQPSLHKNPRLFLSYADLFK